MKENRFPFDTRLSRAIDATFIAIEQTKSTPETPWRWLKLRYLGWRLRQLERRIPADEVKYHGG